MEAGTWVALALGAAGFFWSAVQFFVNRIDAKQRDKRALDADREKRWLQDKRAIYASTQAALSTQLSNLERAEAEVLDDDESVGATALDRVRTGWQPIAIARGELDLLAPQAVRDTVRKAVVALMRYSRAVHISEGETSSEVRARNACSKALQAMRADLGVEAAVVETNG